MNAIKSFVSAWTKFGFTVGPILGCGIIVVFIGIAIYAKWIQPEAEFDKINDQIFESFAQVPRWVWGVFLLVIAGPALALLLASVFMNPLVMAPLAFLQWLAVSIRDFLRKRWSQ